MNGPQHYRVAEAQLRLASEGGPHRDYHLCRAQVHATLALVAATVDSSDTSSSAFGSDPGWIEAVT